jgi:hypothetical protein
LRFVISTPAVGLVAYDGDFILELSSYLIRYAGALVTGFHFSRTDVVAVLSAVRPEGLAEVAWAGVAAVSVPIPNRTVSTAETTRTNARRFGPACDMG